MKINKIPEFNVVFAQKYFPEFFWSGKCPVPPAISYADAVRV